MNHYHNHRKQVHKAEISLFKDSQFSHFRTKDEEDVRLPKMANEWSVGPEDDDVQGPNPRTQHCC